jgi:hypothetical protein
MRLAITPVLVLATTTLAVVACTKEKADLPPPSQPMPASSSSSSSNANLPAYLQRLQTSGDLYVRRDNKIENAPPEEVAVLRSYPSGSIRGQLIEGRRVTILAVKTSVAVGESVRVIHIVEVEKEGEELWVMGPKPVVGEHVDGKLTAGGEIPEWGPFTMGVYDGAVLKSPGVDTNYDITTYAFKERGTHTIQWRAGKHTSNILHIEVK